MTFPTEDVIKELESIQEQHRLNTIVDYNPDYIATYIIDIRNTIHRQNNALIKYFQSRTKGMPLKNLHD